MGLTWVGYVMYLPQLAAHAGIGSGIVGWLLVLDQLIFALCDSAAGVATDRVARVVGRTGTLIAAVTAVSTLSFLLLPFLSRSGAHLFVATIVIWAITSSALRAPPLTLLGRYTPDDQRPWVTALFVIGMGLATASTPFLAGRITAYDPRIPFAASAVAVLGVTLSIAWAEKTLTRAAPAAQPAPAELRFGTLLVFLAAVLLAHIGFQLHNSVNAQRLFAKYAGPGNLPTLLSVFWAGFAVMVPLAPMLVRRLGGVVAMMVGSVVAAESAAAAALATDVVGLSIAQFVSGVAWGTVMVGAVVAAFTIAGRRNAGTAVGALFSMIAIATMARIALVTAHGDRVPAVAATLPWLPTMFWVAAAVLLAPVLLRLRRRGDAAVSGGPTPSPEVHTTAPGPDGRG
ncbi:hypothetical protein A5647_21085 [Mycobacterium sp. 1100029.7]|nr:hypothetical protein A5647_21085 [Mycobacterium sp. 1100029.7]